MNDIRYLTDHYDAKIAQINEFEAPLNFVFITDQHNRLNYGSMLRKDPPDRPYELAADHIRSIQYILDRCPGISYVISGGDIGNDYDKKREGILLAAGEVMDALYALSVPVHCCVGNHDDAVAIAELFGRNSRETAILPDEMHALCMRNNPTQENYYYLDLPDGGFRFVFLNTSDVPYFIDKTGRYYYNGPCEISLKQAVWFEKEALATGRRIIVFSHMPLNNEGVFGTDGEPPYMKDYAETLNAARVYAACKNHPRVCAMIHGHYDNLIYRDHMVIITTLCSFTQAFAPSSPKREFGKLSETAFDVFSIRDNVMRITRFGAGQDRAATLIK